MPSHLPPMLAQECMLARSETMRVAAGAGGMAALSEHLLHRNLCAPASPAAAAASLMSPALNGKKAWRSLVPPTSGKIAPGTHSRLIRDVSAALLACFMGATDGLSLGGIIFPSSVGQPNLDYVSLGMSLGLLSMLAANVGILLGSRLPFSVGGVNIPAVMMLASHFKDSLGPRMCPTIFVELVISTVLVGLVLYLVGRFNLSSFVKACPFVVYGGFMAGTGAGMIACGLTLMCPGFEDPIQPQSYSALMGSGQLQLWAPGFAVGAVLAAVPSSKALPFPSELLVPATLLLMCLAFFSSLALSGVSLESARQAGWLFDVEIPDRITFYRVWTKQLAGLPQVSLDCISSEDFVMAVARAAFISTLTVVMNIFGMVCATGSNIDIDSEMRLHGVFNMLSGAVFGLPCNVVMSFSLSCHSMGSEACRFQLLLSLFSAVVFAFGDFFIALLPRFLPGTVLIHLGFQLMGFWIWDSRLFLRPYEYCLVLAMIFFYVTMGAGGAMLIGLISAILIVIFQSAVTPVIQCRRTLADMRSVALRTRREEEYLRSCSAGVEIWVVAASYLYFASMRQLVDALEALRQPVPSTPEALEASPFGDVEALDDPHGQTLPMHVILDLGLVDYMEVTAVAALREAAVVAAERRCSLVLGSCRPKVAEQMRSFGLPLRRVGSQDHCQAHSSRDRRDAPPIFVASTVQDALEWVEDNLLDLRVAGDVEEATGEDSLQGLWDDIVATFANRDSSLLPVELGSMPVAELAPRLGAFLEVRSYASNEAIYKQRNGGPKTVPPLVWLLRGEAKHIWNPLQETGEVVKGCEQCCGPLKPGQLWEKATVRPQQGYTGPAGPFGTVTAFIAGVSHPASLLATTNSLVALLTRERYDALPPDLRGMLHAYLFASGTGSFVAFRRRLCFNPPQPQPPQPPQHCGG